MLVGAAGGSRDRPRSPGGADRQHHSCVELDHRNDEFDPNEGWNTILQVEYAFPFAAAETEFLKAFVQVAGYLDFGRIGVLAGSFRVGAIEPLNEAVIDSVLPPDLPSRYIPISERFFAGGRTTHRAYKRDRLGIPGETLIADPDAPPDDELDASSLAAVGGNGLLIANLEYRFPIAGPIGGTLFGDFGNLWADWRSINVAEGKPGIGTGVRYSLTDRTDSGRGRLQAGSPPG